MPDDNPYAPRAAVHGTRGQPQTGGSTPYPTRAAYFAEQGAETEVGGQVEETVALEAASTPTEAAAWDPPPAPEEQAVTYEEQGEQGLDEPTFDPNSLGTGSSDEGVAGEDGLNGPTVIRTDVQGTDGLNKCLRCGATEISLNPQTGQLRCHFCRYEWDAQSALDTMGLNTPVEDLVGLVMGSGAEDIIPSTDVVVTFKCEACGAEVVIDTDHSTQARCHWCRNVLSMNEQIPNGAVPDMVLPFKIPKQEAVDKIAEFVGKRKFFAHRKFLKEFDPNNVMGVYLPYMVVDLNAKATLKGQGEHETRRYTVGSGDDKETRYDADVYDIWRTFDLHVDDLTVESSSQRLDQDTKANTNNIINSVMPFDTENAVVYDSNYLSGFTSERRDTNIEQLTRLVELQAGDIARHSARKSIEFFDRGVRWDEETLEVVGQRWVSAYLPVWLYSYHEGRKGGKELLHYVAVNARTGETMGSVPLNQKRLLSVSGVVQVVGIIAFLLVIMSGI